MTLVVFLVCGGLFALGAVVIRSFVDLRMSNDDANAARGQLSQLALAYQHGLPGADRAAGLSGDAMYVVVGASGQVVVASESITRLHPQWTPPGPAPAGAPADWRATVDVTLRSAEHPLWREFRTYRALGQVVDDAQGNRFTAYLFVLPWNTVSTLRVFDDTMVFFIPPAALVAALVAWFALRKTLRSVEAIRLELSGVSGSRLDRRVPVPRSRDEIARLAATTNDTLERLQRAHDRQERFVADASHELRSPLASLRTGLEVALAHPDRADWPAVAERSLLDVQRLQRVTADLLQLSVEEAAPASEVVDLADVVMEQVAERSVGGGPTVRSFVDCPALVHGELVQLERLLRNLLDNAVRHAASTVAVRLSVGREVVLEVMDDGPGVPVGDRERVFDRFVRLDDARTRDVGGSGLGLTLARDIAVRHGGSLQIENSAIGARFVARLPGARASPGLP
ncbi:sensor histidine kinase [Kutzneria sp. NPDC052558]|uniref:sensor histidine kinase n=1 Tax=Kutzneria sp. NPDC052558 TaxID=3364121 RepID=UPI0037CB2C3A